MLRVCRLLCFFCVLLSVVRCCLMVVERCALRVACRLLCVDVLVVVVCCLVVDD